MRRSAGVVTLKAVRDVAVPPADFTTILPVFVPASTRAVILVHDTTVKRAFLPLKVTMVTPQKPEPVIVTCVPTLPLLGVKRVMTGMTRNEMVVVATPPGDVSPIRPNLAPAGTRRVSLVSVTAVKVAGFPPTVTQRHPGVTQLAKRYFPAATVRLSTETTADASPETAFAR